MRTFWNQRYDVADYIYGTEPNQYFREKLENLTSGKLFLPAEGEGRNGVYAATKGWNVEAFDFSPQAREKAIKLAQLCNTSIEYEISGIEDYNYPENAFDVVGLIYVHLAPEIRITFHEQIIRSLKSGGILIMEAFNKKQLKYNSGGPKDEELLYSLSELCCDFAKLNILEKRELKIEISEGLQHRGIGEIVRIYAQKK